MTVLAIKDGPAKSSNLHWIVLVMLGFWPFLSFLDHNRDDAPAYWQSIVVYAVVFVAGLLVLALIGRLVLGRERSPQIAVTLGVGAVCLFNYLPVADVGSSFGISLGSVKIAIWLVLSLAAMALVWRLAERPSTVLILGVAAAAMIVMPAGRLGLFVLEGGRVNAAAAPGSARGPAVAPAKQLPNVYWIVLDSYPRADVLASYFNHRNDDFLAALRSRGFFVADRASANFASTKLSISTTVSMDYYLPVGQQLHPRQWSAKLLGFNPVVDRFMDKGYRYVHVGPGGNNGKTRCGGREQLCVTSSPTGLLGLDEADVGLLRLTAAFPIAQRILPNLLSFDFTSLADVSAKFGVWPESPTFAFVHILSPHPPPRYQKDCRPVPKVAFDLIGDDSDANPGTFLNDLKCLNPQVTSFIDTLLAKDRTDPIIIIQGDHGFRGEPGTLPTPKGPAIDPRLIRYSPLNAMRLPQNCAGMVREDVSLVNTFRIVFTCLGDTDLAPIPDRIFDHAESLVRPVELN